MSLLAHAIWGGRLDEVGGIGRKSCLKVGSRGLEMEPAVTAEQETRQEIDRQMTAADWPVHDHSAFSVVAFDHFETDTSLTRLVQSLRLRP